MPAPDHRCLLTILGARSPSRARLRSLVAHRIHSGVSPEAALAEVAPAVDPPDGRWLAAQAGALSALELTVVLLGEDAFPGMLAEIPDPPIALFVAGQLPAAQSTSVAIVGSRRGSAGGCAWAFAVAAALGRSGIPVVSGLALGVDAAAHRGCLEAGGVTIAVLGAGHQHVYPSRHRSLAQAIAQAGAVVSEYPPDVAPHKHQFPERNRIISGLSRAVAVVEAGAKSGSLITARCALEQGRDVMAVPGLPGGRARGCHRLIQSGAALVEDVDDVFEVLGVPSPGTRGPSLAGLDNTLARVLAEVGVAPVTIDDLAERLAQSPAMLRAALLELELRGFVASEDGGYIRRPH